MSSAPPAHALSGRYLIFRLGSEYFGLPIACVSVVLRLRPWDLVPSSSGSALSLRGRTVPLVDLHPTLGVQNPVAVERPVVVVVQQQHLAVRSSTALRVDEVIEICQLGADQIEPAPRFGATGDTDRYLLGTAREAQRTLRLLDLDRALAAHALLTPTPARRHHHAARGT